MIDVPLSNLRAVGKRLLDDFGFTLDPGHSALLGVCASCRQAELLAVGLTSCSWSNEGARQETDVGPVDQGRPHL